MDMTNWKFFVLLILLTLLSCSSKSENGLSYKLFGSKNNSDQLIDIKAYKYTLENGLRVIIHENHKLPIFSYYTFFDVGGRFEPDHLVGGTHFLEHMMFKGAKKYGPGSIENIVEGNGGFNNAYTSRDLTVYDNHMPSGTLEQIIDLEVDRMQNLLLEPVSFETERNVVLDERLRNYDSNPRNLLFLRMMEAIFEKTPYGRSVIGTSEEIKNIKREDMLKYFHANYAPNNAVIVISGDVNVSEVMKQITQMYGPLPASADLSKYKENINQDKLYRHQGRYKRDIEINGINPYPMYILAYKGEKVGTRKGFVLDILASILGSGESSFLNLEFVNSKKPVLNNVYAGHYALFKNGVFIIGGEMLPQQKLKPHKTKLISSLKKICNDQQFAMERAVKKIKNQYLVQMINQLKTNEGVAHFLGQEEIAYGDFEYYKKEFEIYNSITAAEVVRVCNELFSSDEHIFISIWTKHLNK